MSNFGLLDWWILGLFFAGSLLLGSYFFKGQVNTEDYLLAGRRMPWFPVALSIVATNNSAGSYMGVPTYIYTNNFMFYFNNITLVLITPLVIVLFLNFYHKLKVFTAYELDQEALFSKHSCLRPNYGSLGEAPRLAHASRHFGLRGDR